LTNPNEKFEIGISQFKTAKKEGLSPFSLKLFLDNFGINQRIE
jgi:hypothetical protein